MGEKKKLVFDESGATGREAAFVPSEGLFHSSLSCLFCFHFFFLTFYVVLHKNVHQNPISEDSRATSPRGVVLVLGRRHEGVR